MKIFDIVLFEEQIVLQVTEPLLEQLTGDELNGILEYYKEDFNIGGYTYQKEKDWDWLYWINSQMRQFKLFFLLKRCCS